MDEIETRGDPWRDGENRVRDGKRQPEPQRGMPDPLADLIAGDVGRRDAVDREPRLQRYRQRNERSPEDLEIPAAAHGIDGVLPFGLPVRHREANSERSQTGDPARAYRHALAHRGVGKSEIRC